MSDNKKPKNEELAEEEQELENATGGLGADPDFIAREDVTDRYENLNF